MARAQKGTENQTIGKSRGGLTTKVPALVDALGNLANFLLLASPAYRAWLACSTTFCYRHFFLRLHHDLYPMEATSPKIDLRSALTCPKFGHVEIETMPTDACQWFDDCIGCGVLLRSKPGDCYVFCSCGTVTCPPIEEGRSCCGQA